MDAFHIESLTVFLFAIDLMGSHVSNAVQGNNIKCRIERKLLLHNIIAHIQDNDE